MYWYFLTIPDRIYVERVVNDNTVAIDHGPDQTVDQTVNVHDYSNTVISTWSFFSSGDIGQYLVTLNEFGMYECELK
eukprot:Pgem_evm1s17435